jgi:hypothetical protein
MRYKFKFIYSRNLQYFRVTNFLSTKIQEPEVIYDEVTEEIYQSEVKKVTEMVVNDDGTRYITEELDDLGQKYADESEYEDDPIDGVVLFYLPCLLVYTRFLRYLIVFTLIGLQKSEKEKVQKIKLMLNQIQLSIIIFYVQPFQIN